MFTFTIFNLISKVFYYLVRVGTHGSQIWANFCYLISLGNPRVIDNEKSGLIIFLYLLFSLINN